MKRWRCEECGLVVKAIAVEVTHKCRGKMRRLVEVRVDQ